MREAIVTGGNLRLRAFGSVSAEILGVLPDGTKLLVKAAGDEWTHVQEISLDPETPAETGYVMTRFLRFLPEEKKEKAKGAAATGKSKKKAAVKKTVAKK